MKKNIWIYDLETYYNIFLACFYNIETEEWKIFEISDRINEINNLRKFLYEENLQLIGFNNINFDYPVLHNTILSNNLDWTSQDIFYEVQKIIAAKYSAIWDNETKIPQLDLFKIWHYDNKNKSTSLKWIEFAIRWKNVQDLPYEPFHILNEEEMDVVVDYCKNDVLATYEFFKKSSKHIELREFYTKHEKINLINASEIKISKEIFSKHLAKHMDISQYNVKQLRTHRSKVDINDIIFNYLKFEDPINQSTLKRFKNSTWWSNDSSISFSVSYKNVIREYAEGGLHSFGKPGIYKSDDNYVLVDLDFASFYPHISFRNNLHPAHIPGDIFNKIYEGFYKERKNYPKKDPRNYVLKIILNGSYGLSRDQYSFLYDPAWQLGICINGQLILTLLTEHIFKYCKNDVQIIFENTDGAMYRIHRSDMDLLQEACKEVEKIVNIPLETQVCEKIIARDVNNYINIISSDNIKFKGAFEIDRDYHKNHSKRIVPVALAEYFINGIKPEDTIYNYIGNKSTNIIKETKDDKPIYYENYGIYDFCLGAKMKGDNKLYKRYIKNFYTIDDNIGKMNRYYVSNGGYELIKKLPPLEKDTLTATDKYKNKVDSNQMNIFDIIEDVAIDPKNRETNIEAGFKCTLFNKYEEYDYDLNYNYYLNECYKIINIFPL